MNWKKFGQILQQVAPIALSLIPKTQPIAGIVAHAMSVANNMPGASGAEKKALALQLIEDGIAATNAQAGRTVIDPAAGLAAGSSAIETAYGVTKIIHDAQPDEPTPA